MHKDIQVYFNRPPFGKKVCGRNLSKVSKNISAELITLRFK